MKYKYKLNNLDCPNCAAKIEKALNESREIKNAIVNFSNLSLTIETDLKNPQNHIKDIIKKIDSKVVVLDINEKQCNNTIVVDIIRLTLGTSFAISSLFFERSNC